MDERHPRFDHTKRDEAARLYREERLSERQVAERLGVSKTTARRYLNDARVRRRRMGAPRGNQHAAKNRHAA